MELTTLREKRGKLVADGRAILDKAKAEKRAELSAEENSQWDKIEVELRSVEDTINRLEKQAAHEAALKESAGRQVTPDAVAKDGAVVETRTEKRASEEYAKAHRAYLSQAANRDRVLTVEEYRALQAGVDPLGGYFVPHQMVSGLLKALDNTLPFRQFASKFTVSGSLSLGQVSLETDPSACVWGTEISSVTENTAMRYGKRELKVKPLTTLVKASATLLRVSSEQDSLIRSRVSYVGSTTQETAFMTGGGVDRPLGVFIASDSGIPTGRDVTTGSATTVGSADKWVTALYTLKDQYRRTARWIMHRDVISALRKLKDGQNQYLWQPGLQAGQPDVFLGLPLTTSEYAPNTFTDGNYAALLGDLSYYYIVDSTEMSMKVLGELYAESNQVGYIYRQELDGMPVLSEAFVRVKFAA